MNGREIQGRGRNFNVVLGIPNKSISKGIFDKVKNNENTNPAIHSKQKESH